MVKIPEIKGKIYEKTIKDVTYINYEYDQVYKPDKKYNIPKRTTIGKKCADDPEMMYPNPNFLTYFPDAELPKDQSRDERSNCLRIGSFFVIEKLMMVTMLDKIIRGIYNDDRGSGLFMDLASYYLILENNAGQYYPDYAYNHPLITPGYKIYSDSTISIFTKQISVDDSVEFLNGMQSGRNKIRSIFPMIQRTKTVRTERLISQNSDTQKKKRDFRSSTIPSPMTVKTGNRSFMKVIPEALWMCHSCSLC